MNLDHRFDTLTYPVHKVDPEKDLLEEYPVFARYQEFTGYTGSNLNKILRYIIFMYDPHTPLLREFKDLAERKDIAMQLAGFERLNSGDWPARVLDIKKLAYEPVLRMILRFMEMQHNVKMDMIHTFEQMASEYRDLLLKPVHVDKGKTKEGKPRALNAKEQKDIYAAADFKKKLREELMGLKTDLDVLFEEVFGDNGDILDTWNQQRMNTPEAVATIKLTA